MWGTHKIYTSFDIVFLPFTMKVQKQPPEVSYKKGVLKNFAKFTGKHLRRSLFFNKEKKPRYRCEFCEIFKNTIFTKHLRTAASLSTKSTLHFNTFWYFAVFLIKQIEIRKIGTGLFHFRSMFFFIPP